VDFEKNPTGKYKMSITIYSGKPGSGKSLKMADIIMTLLARNQKWALKTDHFRKVVTNLKLSPEVEQFYKGFYEYWQDPLALVKYSDVDIVWDEMILIKTHKKEK